MKTNSSRNWLVVIFCLLASLIVATGAQAQISLDIPAEPTSGEPIVLNPAQIRQALLEGSTSIMLGAIRVHQTREQLNVTRANLLPSVNLGALLMQGGSFGLGAVSADFFLPFLLPHKWFENLKAKHLVEAEKSAYLVLELNQYNAALGLYYTYLNDLGARDAQMEEIKQFERIETATWKAYQVGAARKDEYEQAQAQTSIARVRVTRINELIVYERALLRHSLGLPLNRPITVERVSLPESKFELKSAIDLLPEAVAKAPERAQLDSLMSAAKAEKWEKIFSFVNVFSLGRKFNSSSAEGGGAFGGLLGSGNLSIGFSYIPNIRLSNNNKEQIRIQGEELNFELSEILERTLNQITVVKNRLTESTTTENVLNSVFDIKLKRYELGMDKFTDLLIARSQLREATLERLKTQSELNILRGTLARTFMEGEFSKIRGCTLGAFAAEKKKRTFILSWFKDIFMGSSNDWVAVERICSARK